MTETITINKTDFELLKSKGVYIKDSVGQESIIIEGIILKPDMQERGIIE